MRTEFEMRSLEKFPRLVLRVKAARVKNRFRVLALQIKTVLLNGSVKVCVKRWE